MQKGYLVVRTTAANGAIPLSARIEVLCGGALVYAALSDESGRTAAIELDAVQAAYGVADVRAAAHGYRPVEVRGVQIVAGETAVLPVGLEPALRADEPPVVHVIPPRRADMPAPMAARPPAGRLTQLLDVVAVPQSITVHLGCPAAPAPNVTVGFTSYIKNVCSHALDPTWPEAALRAMIHCRISIALNRVYTAWYRSRGYGFDITGAASYDAQYVPGRNSYATIDRLVDEVFSIYVRRAGAVEPFFACSCDVDQPDGSGMRQAEAVALAQAGRTPQEILRHFFGADCGLAQTELVQGALHAYPGVTLTVGSAGVAMETMQRQLNAIRRRYTVLPMPDADGVFGAATKAAVQAFQQLFDLQADGTVGRATWYKLNRFAAAAERCAALAQEDPIPDAQRPQLALRQGSRGEAVLCAQQMLNVAADFYGGVQLVAADGVFGHSMQATVMDVQRLCGLVPDGLLDERTWDGLYAACAACRRAAKPV